MFGKLDSCSQKTKSEPEVKSFVFLLGRARYVLNTYAVRDPSRGIICRNTVGYQIMFFNSESLPKKVNFSIFKDSTSKINQFICKMVF